VRTGEANPNPHLSPVTKDRGPDILGRHLPGTNPAGRCLPIGIPAAGLVSELNEIVQ